MMSTTALAPGQHWRYDAALPADRSELAKAFKLLETYSHIPADQVEDHVKRVVSSISAWCWWDSTQN
jgi:hypothetical protein